MPKLRKGGVRLNNAGLLIYQAAATGDLDRLELVFSSVPQEEAKNNINYTDGHGLTPLLVAAKKGSFSCVKLLLYHGANINHSFKYKLQNQFAWHVAKKSGHSSLEQYLRKCRSDYARLNTTRAKLEQTVIKIATNPNCPLSERARFDDALKQLIKSCDYDLTSTDHVSGNSQPLIIRAARADNIPIVVKLLKEYQVNEETHDMDTAETLMHIACLNKSKLRYYLVQNYPSLMRKRDVNGTLPLHITCKNNDLEFISWLFRNIVEVEDRDSLQPLQPMQAIHRARSHTDLASTAVAIPPNRSVQSVFPMSPVDLTSPSHRTMQLMGYHSIDGGSAESASDDTSSHDKDDTGLLSPLYINLREQGFLKSYESSRSFSVSISGSSRSGSSERSLPKSRSIDPAMSDSDGRVDCVDMLGLTEIKENDDSPNSSKNPQAPNGVVLTTQEDVKINPAHCNGRIVPEIGVSEDTEEGSMTSLDHEIEDFLTGDNFLAPHSLTISDVVDMKPFSYDVRGDSIFHILSREGFVDTLEIIIKVATFLKHQVDLSILTHREGYSSRLPIEEAIYEKHPECVEMLIRLSMVSGLMPVLLQDPHLLRVAVITNDVKLVRILIENGFHRGLQQAISLAIISEFDDILRILLYWQTQVINSMEHSRMKVVNGQRVRTLDKGIIKWEEIQLETVDRQWLIDSCNAITTVSQVLRFSRIASDITEYDFEYFKRLGRDCMHYFDNFKSDSWANQLQMSLTPITELNISENQLTAIPVEIFQMTSLHTLRLSHNKLQSLPNSDSLDERLYTSSIIKLDLDSNMLTSLPEDLCLGLSHSLRELSAQHNQLDSLPPGLWVMPNLRKIKLGHNKLERLHYLSTPSYFNDVMLSKRVSSWFTVDEGGELVCTNENKDSREVFRCERYIRRLAKFYKTVCTARCPKGTKVTANIYQEIIHIHMIRSFQSTHREEGAEETTLPPSAQILSLYEDEEFEAVTRCTMDIEILDLFDNKFREFPWDLACISPNLKKLDIRENSVAQMDVIHSVPRNINSMILVSNQLVALNKDRSFNLPCGNPLRLLCVQDETESYCEHCNHPTLDKLSNLIIDRNNLSYFPIIDTPRSTESEGFEVVYCDPYYPELSILSLARNSFTSVPKHLHRLTHLSSLTLSHNAITELPLEMGLMNTSNLLLLKLEGLFLRNVPETMMAKHNPKALLNHLKALKQKSRPHRRMKLMVVGAANMGKTSLLLSLVKRGRMKRCTEVERGVNDLPLATVGVELGDWEYSHGGKPKVTFMTWDFGGQEEYYATHQCFLTRRSLYLLVWNVMDGTEGLNRLKPWLENIEGRAPKSPVIIVGTHIDLIPQDRRWKELALLQEEFTRMYLRDSHRKFTYPSICEQIQFINVNNPRHVDSLRDYVYELAIQYKIQGPSNHGNDKPLLDEPIPESYLVLQDFVRELAQTYVTRRLKPIVTKKNYIRAIRESEISDKITEADINQATNFLHDSGILLHFEDSSLLNDLYFINPQWLCSMLAKLITIKEHNPYQRQGFMIMEDVKKIYPDCFQEVIILMQKFEVVFQLDESRLVIPSLLPLEEDESCLVFARSLSHCLNDSTLDQLQHQPHAPMYETPHVILTRFYLLPFVPNGFFSRLMARLLSSDMIDHLQQSLMSNQMGMTHVANTAHWKCWRRGILITWNHMEVFRIAPLSNSSPGLEKVSVVTKKDTHTPTNVSGGLEIRVAILPDEYITTCSTLKGQLNTSLSYAETLERREECSRGKCLSTWLLHQATTAIDSVFEDWYECFARKKGFDPHQENVRITNPCHMCMQRVQEKQLEASRHINMCSTPSGVDCVDGVEGGSRDDVCYVFTSTYVVHVSAGGGREELVCPDHGTLRVADVAPDLVFCDFLPGTVFADSTSLVLRQQLGDGGFGTVYRATLHTRGNVETVAAKQFNPDMGFLEHDPDIIEQLKAWDLYQKASMEARVMHQLSHSNILGLVGIALHPLSLLVELAPGGDLKGCVERFKREKVRLSRRTLQATLIQVAEALDYLHSRQFIYRDLKPENILVWKFPSPGNQWFPGSPVHVKVADYGISKQITPQGIRGMEGTRPYLPPEVILHGGREAYSTKLDVYGFGMFIYYLVSYRAPFDSGRPITALLEEGKRPELLPRQRPHSLMLFELMCWCWSDRPNSRPDFSAILSILKSDMFTHLLASFIVQKSEEEFTTSCMRLSRSRRVSGSLTYSTAVDASLASLGVMSLVYGKSGFAGEEYATQVWYGTEFGKFGMVQFQTTGTIHEQFELPDKKTKFISAIRFISGKIWVATVGVGLLVYDPNQSKAVAQWGASERYQIYTLIEVPEKEAIVALTHKGTFVFASELAYNEETNMESLLVLYELRDLGIELNIGVLVSSGGQFSRSEIWAGSLAEQYLSVLDTHDFTLVAQVPFEVGTKRRPVRHMINMEVDSKAVLAVANKHLIHFFDCMERRMMTEMFDCKEISSAVSGNQASHTCRVASLAAKDHFLYAAVKGIILCLNCESMEVVHIFDAYHKAVRSLLIINYSEQHSKPFSRLMSVDKQKLEKSLQSHKLSKSNSEDSQEGVSKNSILVSFGVGFKGTVSNYYNHPESFILPSEGSRTSSQPARPDHNAGYVLLWSTEVSKKRTEPQAYCEVKLDENEELELPESFCGVETDETEESELVLGEDVITGL